MALEMSNEASVCSRCGRKYGRIKGYFPTCYSKLYKGVGHLHICKECLESLYAEYLAECNDPKMAVRQMCRKLDLYWNERAYEMAAAQSANRSLMGQYILKANTRQFLGKCYDDTLREEASLWQFGEVAPAVMEEPPEEETEQSQTDPSIVERWGKGYTDEMYKELEHRWDYWMSKFPDGIDLDIGTEALLRQICSLELDIKRDRIAGKPVDKSVGALNTLLGSAQLKPGQQQSDADTAIDNTPMGVWIKKYETQRPIPEPDPELEDVDGLTKYILTWVYGHLAKMLNIKNARTQLYDEAIERLRVDHPEYEDEDDEDLLFDIFGDNESEVE